MKINEQLNVWGLLIGTFNSRNVVNVIKKKMNTLLDKCNKKGDNSKCLKLDFIVRSIYFSYFLK